MTPAERLKQARLSRGYATAADAARAYGWSIVTYTSHENGTRGIRPDAAERYARAFGLSAAEILGFKQRREIVEDLIVIAQAALGHWRDERLALPHAGAQKLTISAPDFAGKIGQMRFAVEVCDESVNKVIGEGEYAVCTAIAQDDIQALPDGSLVWVERHRGGLMEHSIRRLTRVGHEKFLLRSHSKNATLTDDVPFPAEGDERIEIRGRVVGRYARLDL